MNEKIRVVVDYTTPTRERRPTTIEDIYDDFKVLEFNSKEELADELARMNGYENLEEFKQELIDEGDDLDDYDFEGDELDKICQYFLSSMTDPGDGSPNIQYISINDKPAYEDYWMTYDSLSDNMELLARGSEEDIVKYFLKYEYDYVEDEDDSEDDEELEESFKSMDKKGLYEAVKDIKEDVETVYKVISVIFPDEEEIEEFGSKEDAMEYAQEQISSEDYNEVIVSEVTIDEDGYEDETILLDEQSEYKSNAYYALHTFYEDEPDEIDIDSLEVFESEEEAMKRAKELEAKGLRVVINIEGDESAGWDSEEYEYYDIGDEIYSTPYIMEEDVKSNKKMRTEQDWEDELKDNNSEISHVINSLQSELNRGVPYADAINLTIDAIHDAFISGNERDLDTQLAVARVSYLDKDYRRGDEYPEIEVFYRIYFTDKDGDELYAVDDNDFHFKADYKTRRKALAAMKKILKDPKVQADPEIGGCHSVFTIDEDEWDEDSEGYYNFYGYEPFEVVDEVDKENLKESFKSKDKYSEFQIECKFKDDPEWYELVGCDGIYYEIDEITHGELSKYEKHNPHEYVFPTKEIADKFASIVRKISRGYGITKVRVIENSKPGEALEEETSFKSKDKYSVLREALDRLDEEDNKEDNKGKKIKARAQIRTLRSKLKQ